MQRIIVLIIVTILAISCKKEGFKISASIDGIPNGRKVYLKKQENRKIVVIDSTTIQNGKFAFKGTIKEPLIYGIFIDSIKKGGIFPFTGISDNITITAYKDSLIKSEISGSKLHDELSILRKERETLKNESQNYIASYQDARKNKDSVKIEAINSELRKIQNKMVANDWDYVNKHPNSYITPLVLAGLMYNPAFKDSVRHSFNKLSKNIKEANISKPIRDFFEQEKIKATAPPIPPMPAAPKNPTKTK